MASPTGLDSRAFTGRLAPALPAAVALVALTLPGSVAQAQDDFWTQTSRDLARALRRFGYEVTRESGSHLRLTTQDGGEHHLTIPDHANLRVGTLAAILTDVANHLKIERSALVTMLFER